MRQVWILALLVATGSVLFAQDTEAPADEEAGVRLFKKVDPAVVAIKHEEAGGSGFIIPADGYILTNRHVISGYNGAEEDPRVVAKRITSLAAESRNTGLSCISGAEGCFWWSVSDRTYRAARAMGHDGSQLWP